MRTDRLWSGSTIDIVILGNTWKINKVLLLHICKHIHLYHTKYLHFDYYLNIGRYFGLEY